MVDATQMNTSIISTIQRGVYFLLKIDISLILNTLQIYFFGTKQQIGNNCFTDKKRETFRPPLPLINYEKI
jgi:hypothetical protein